MKEYKLIKNTKNYYACSDGFIYSKFENRNNGKLFRLSTKKYVNIGQKVYAIKKIIADTFLPNPNNYKYIIFLDGNENNTKPENLKWVETRNRITYIDYKTDKLIIIKIGIMIAYCHNKSNSNFKGYGLKGITVCKEWRDNTENFLKWSKDKYFKGAFLVRIDKNKGFSPDNCFWGSREHIQKLNCEMVYDIKDKLETFSPNQIANKYSVSSERIRQIKRGKTLKNCN